MSFGDRNSLHGHKVSIADYVKNLVAEGNSGNAASYGETHIEEPDEADGTNSVFGKFPGLQSAR